LDTTEERLPPRLVVQIWDNDTFNPDDFIGNVFSLVTFISTISGREISRSPRSNLHQMNHLLGSVELPLDQMPMPFSKPKKIKDIKCLEDRKTQSLFDQKQMFGWWPVFGEIETKGKKDPSLMVGSLYIKYIYRGTRLENSMLNVECFF
jgi:hypothetical protein